MKRYLLILIIISGIFTSCKNGDWEFPDYEYTAAYFAYQTPVRTIVIGEDVYDTTLDNEHKCQIMATMGGVYENKKDVEIGFRIDNALCNGLTFDGGAEVKAMPSNYYTLSSTEKIVIKKGNILGGVVVQLTDAFFADPLAVKNTYVIPLVMTDVKNVDKILTGTPLANTPNRVRAEDWDVLPKDYILYAIKYINKYHANYLRRGKDVITGDKNETVIRRKEYVEKDEVVGTHTRSLNMVELPLRITDATGELLDCTLLLSFDDSGKCAVSSGSQGVTMSGSGQYVVKGEKGSWGNKDRDAIYLNYNINFGKMQVSTVDTLVIRDRGVKPETFKPILK
ncbi:DUF5627 domain-containing protein [Dysgonomonas gadei]|uniref:DUF5627 domain-containing protein n=1 Tax=Dysgonomonas gadei TaxID=156974 RepID=UPI003AF0485A